MSPTEEFLKKHGPAWLKIVQSPTFSDAMLLLNLEKMKGITALTPQQIKENGSEILADLVGHLKHENDLMTLHEKREFEIPDLSSEETYSEEEPTILPEKKKKGKK